jgi:hypothetical protein
MHGLEEDVLILADNACNNIVFVFKPHYYNYIWNEITNGSAYGNPTYTKLLNLKIKFIKTVGYF